MFGHIDKADKTLKNVTHRNYYLTQGDSFTLTASPVNGDTSLISKIVFKIGTVNEDGSLSEMFSQDYVLLNDGVYYLVLEPLKISYMDNVVFILIIASLVQFTELLVKKYFPALYKEFGVYLPLITTNCIVLGVALNNITLGHNLLQVIVYSLSISVGYMMVMFIFSAIREQLEKAPVPKAFKGVPIALICAAFMALAFTGFAGIV